MTKKKQNKFKTTGDEKLPQRDTYHPQRNARQPQKDEKLRDAKWPQVSAKLGVLIIRPWLKAMWSYKYQIFIDIIS